MPTKIQWSHPPGYIGETLNILNWCTKVSPACTHCYAESINIRFKRSGPFMPGEGAVTQLLDRVTKPLGWKAPRCIFVCSTSDLFHEEVPFEFIDELFAVIAMTPRHIYQLLTKRPERMRDYLESRSTPDGRVGIVSAALRLMEASDYELRLGLIEWPLPNVWVGTSVENQTWADRRLAILIECDAVVRFISFEPLLRQVNVTKYLDCLNCFDGMTGNMGDRVPCRVCHGTNTGIQWFLVGGESGSQARPTHVDWARSLLLQARDYGVPFFHKQWGRFRPTTISDPGAKYRWLSPGGRLLDKREPVTVGRDVPMILTKKDDAVELDGTAYHEWPHIITGDYPDFSESDLDV